MNFSKKIMRFIIDNQEEIEKPMNLGFAIYVYYLVCILGMILCGIFFSTSSYSVQRTIIDAAILVAMCIFYCWIKSKYDSKEKWTKRKMDWKKFLCICFLSRLTSWIGACIIFGIVSFFGIDYSSFYGTPTSMGYSFSAILSAVIFGPVCEELIFRGIGLIPFEKKDNKVEILIFLSVIFGLMHSNWYQAIVATLDGFLFGYVAIEFGLFYAILLHAFHNALVYLAYFLNQFVDMNCINFAILVLVIFNIKKVINQFKIALKSERKYSIEKQVAYFMNPIIFVCSILWILEIL